MTNELFYYIPGTCEISYFDGVSTDILTKLEEWIDGDSSLGDCDIGYNEFEDTFTGTFTNGQTVLFDRDCGVWYES